MKYLMSTPPPVIHGAETMAPGGEPVIPWFPAPVRSVFLSIESFRDAAFATVEEVDIDPDVLADTLCKRYPGLPRQLHENYVMATALAARMLEIGERVRPIITEDVTQLQVVNTPKVLTLWEEQPIKGKVCKPSIVTL